MFMSVGAVGEKCPKKKKEKIEVSIMFPGSEFYTFF